MNRAELDCGCRVWTDEEGALNMDPCGPSHALAMQHQARRWARRLGAEILYDDGTRERPVPPPDPSLN